MEKKPLPPDVWKIEKKPKLVSYKVCFKNMSIGLQILLLVLIPIYKLIQSNDRPLVKFNKHLKTRKKNIILFSCHHWNTSGF